jgi:syntaxin-binding protein 1
MTGTNLGLFQEMSSENKLRLLMIYAATHPEKLDATKRSQWQKVFKFLSLHLDLIGDNVVSDLDRLGISMCE